MRHTYPRITGQRLLVMRFSVVALIVGLSAGVSGVAHASTGPTCPAFGPDTPSGPNRSTLAPPHPDAAILCHYNGGNETGKNGFLRFSVRIKQPAALAALLNQATPTTPNMRCPVNFKGQDNVRFRTGSVVIDVLIETSGCRDAISNNTSGGWLLSASALAALAELDPSFRSTVPTPSVTSSTSTRPATMPPPCPATVTHRTQVKTPTGVGAAVAAYVRQHQRLTVMKVADTAELLTGSWWAVGVHTCVLPGASQPSTFTGFLPKGTQTGYGVMVRTDQQVLSGGNALFARVAQVKGRWRVLDTGTSP